MVFKLHAVQPVLSLQIPYLVIRRFTARNPMPKSIRKRMKILPEPVMNSFLVMVCYIGSKMRIVLRS